MNMSLTRWQPLKEMMTLRDAMNHLFDESVFQPLTLGGVNGNNVPLDIIEQENELLVRAAVPGFDPEQIDISIQGDVLTLQGKMEEQHEDKRENYHLREYRSGSFHRSVRLPVGVDADSARAEVRNGMLTLHLPRAEAEARRRIEIQHNNN
jgi:HSP20 family protein